MKNFFKKLSFVLASAMVITSLYAPANAEAASNFVRVKGSKKAVTSKDIFVGGRKVNFDYTIGKKMTGIHGTWTSSDTSVAVVDKKTGVVKAVSNGTATITFKTKKTKSMKKVVTIKTTVNTFTRAKAVELSTATAEVKLGESLDVTASLISIDKAGSSNSTYNLVASSSDEKIATAKVDGTTISISPIATGSATLTVFARHKNGDKYDTPKVELPVTVIGALEAKQVKANKVLVKGSNLSDKAADYMAKGTKNNTLKFKDMVVLNADKTEATLEYETSQIPEDTYTLTFDKAEATFTAEKAKVAKIVLIPEGEAFAAKANSGDTSYTVAYSYYKVFDQFENDVTNTSVASDVIVTGGTAVTPKGTIKFENSAGFIPGMSTVAVSVVDRKTSIQATGVLKVTNEARAQEVEFAGIWDVSKSEFVKSIPENANLSVYRLLFKATTSHGVPIDYNKAADNLSVMLITTTGLTLKDKGNEYEVKGMKYAAYTIGYPGNATKLDREGKVEVRAIALYGGKTIAEEFEVTSMSKVDKLEVFDDNGIYAGDTVVLNYKAYDTAGNMITDWKTLSQMNKGGRLKASDNGTVRFEKTRDKKVILTYTPHANTQPQDKTVAYVTVSWQTITNNFGNKIMTVNPARKPVGIIGLAKDVAVGATRFTNNQLAFKVKDFVYEDQYGNPMSADKLVSFNSYKIKPEMSLNYFKVDSAIAAITANNKDTAVLTLKTGTKQEATPGNATGPKAKIADESSYSERVKVTLLDSSDKELGSFGFDVYNVILENVQDIVVKDIPLLAASTGNNNHVKGTDGNNLGANDNDYTPVVYGFYAGKKVSLSVGLEKDFFVENGKAGSSDEKIAVPSADVLPDNKKTDEAEVTVVINNSAATKIKKTYKYSREDAVPAKVILANGTELTISTSDSSSKYWKDIKTNFKLVSQYYNDQIKTDDKVAYTNMTNHVPYLTINDYNDTILEVDKNGQKGDDTAASGFSFKFTGGDSTDDKVTLTVTVPGSSAKFEDIVTIKQ